MNVFCFELKVLRQHWIEDNGKDDKNDLCSHGEVYLKIGSEELSNKESGSWTTSAAGLYLLRSLEQDCELNEFYNHLLPCCGFNIYPNKEKDNFVDIIGCPNGIDWKISHRDNIVKLETEKGTKVELPFMEYTRIVLKFVNEVEAFYGNPNEKIIYGDDLEKEGFNQFWGEWEERKAKWR